MQRSHRPWVYTTLAATLAAFLVAMLTIWIGTYSLAGSIRTSQKTNTGTLKTTQQTLDAVKSCTTPGRPCYDRGQRATAKAVGDINRVIVLASACAVGLDPSLRVGERQAAIQDCVITRLAAQTGRRR